MFGFKIGMGELWFENKLHNYWCFRGTFFFFHFILLLVSIVEGSYRDLCLAILAGCETMFTEAPYCTCLRIQ